MAAQVVFSLKAIKELEKSSAWYEERAEGVGKRFVKTIKETLVLASINPEMFPKKKSYHREIVVDGFPYLIVYRYDKKEDVINVLHVFHTSRNPKLKYKRK